MATIAHNCDSSQGRISLKGEENKAKTIDRLKFNPILDRSKFKFKVAFTNYSAETMWTGAGIGCCFHLPRQIAITQFDDAIIIALTFLITRTTELDIDPFVRPETRLITRGELCVTSQIKFVNVVIDECRFNRVRLIERVSFFFFFHFKFSPLCRNNDFRRNLNETNKFFIHILNMILIWPRLFSTRLQRILKIGGSIVELKI